MRQGSQLVAKEALQVWREQFNQLEEDMLCRRRSGK